MTQVVGFTPEDWPHARDAINSVRRGASEHPFHRRQPLTDVPELLVCKANANIAKGAFGMFSIWDGALGSEIDTGDDVEGYVRYGDISSGQWAALYPKNDGYEAIAAEC